MLEQHLNGEFRKVSDLGATRKAKRGKGTKKDEAAPCFVHSHIE